MLRYAEMSIFSGRGHCHSEDFDKALAALKTPRAPPDLETPRAPVPFRVSGAMVTHMDENDGVSLYHVFLI